MRLRDMVSMALGSLFKRKVRTLLTVAGVVIGTCAIVVMLSLGIGMKQSMETMMQNMGDLTVITVNRGGKSEDASALDDKALEQFKQLPNVAAVTPVLTLDSSRVTLSCRKYTFQGMFYGVDMAALKDFGYKAESGELPGKGTPGTDVLFGKNAAYDFMDSKKKDGAMINPQPDKNGKLPAPYVDLMKDKFQIAVTLPEKSTAKLKPAKLRVLGTLAEDYGKNPNPSDCVFMDVGFVKQLIAKYNRLNNVKTDVNKKQSYDFASVKVKAEGAVDAAEQSIKEMGFETNSMESVRKPLEKQLQTVQMILGGLGAISLLVAALGITNTMVMSIYERTREIGIMKVLGCVVGNIRVMFLMEAGAIGLLGGLSGIALSYGISAFLNFLTGQHAGRGEGGGLFTAAGGSISIVPWWLAAGAVLFATLVGLVSGLYPANRAVKISPLTAIKQE